MAKPVVRVYQEDWWPFQNLPRRSAPSRRRPASRPSCPGTRSASGSIETMFEHMVHSFTDDDPPYDLICTDEVMLRRFAVDGRVMPMNDRMRRDGITLDDVTDETRRVVTVDGAVIGLPCINVVNLLLYRRDLLDRYSLPVPQSWDEVKSVGLELQKAVRRDGDAEFYAFATRGAGGGGHAVWTMGSFLGSFGGRWLTDESHVEPIRRAHRAALAAYLDILTLRRAARPGRDQLRRAHPRLPQGPGRDDRRGRDGICPPAPRRSHAGREVRRRHDPGRPGGPPPEPLRAALVDPRAFEGQGRGLGAGEVPVDASAAPRGRHRLGCDRDVVAVGALQRRLRPPLPRRPPSRPCVSSRAVAFEERPFGRLGMEANVVVGQTVNDALTGHVGLDDALARIHAGLTALAAKA